MPDVVLWVRECQFSSAQVARSLGPPLDRSADLTMTTPITMASLRGDPPVDEERSLKPARSSSWRRRFLAAVLAHRVPHDRSLVLDASSEVVNRRRRQSTMQNAMAVGADHR